MRFARVGCESFRDRPQVRAVEPGISYNRPCGGTARTIDDRWAAVIDWTDLPGYYERLGFERWIDYEVTACDLSMDRFV